MTSRQLAKGTQIGHVRACRRFAAWLKRSPETATVDEVRLFQLHLTETGTSIQTRNRTRTGLRFRLIAMAPNLQAWVLLSIGCAAAISNRRLVAADANTVSFKYKDFRLDGAARFKTIGSCYVTPVPALTAAVEASGYRTAKARLDGLGAAIIDGGERRF